MMELDLVLTGLYYEQSQFTADKRSPHSREIAPAPMTAIPLPSPFPQQREKLDAVLVCALLVVGMYVPVSFGAERMFVGPAYLSSAFLLSLLIFRRGRTPSVALTAGSLFILPLLIFFTFTTGFNAGTWGEFGQFTTLALLYIVTLKDVQFPRWGYSIYVTVNVINIVLGAAILAGSDLVKDVLVSYYSQGYQDLVPAMLLWRKPVLTFGTHSVAGFFLYLFFYINWQTYRVRGKRLFLAFAVCYLVLTLALLSVTGLLLSAVGAIQMLHGLWVSSKRRWLWTYGVAVAAAVVVMLEWDFLDRYGSDIVEGARAILTSPGNGLLGRLTPTGTMYGVVQYVMNHPFSPVGLSRDDNLLFADMGILDYLVRGSVILVVWVYGGLLLFLKRNLSAKADVYFLFAAIVAFELGYSVLLFYRIPLLLAFFVVYLNGLRQSQGAAPSLAPGRE